MICTLPVKDYVLERNKTICLIQRADFIVGGLAVKKHEPAANLLEDHMQFVGHNRKNVFHMNRVIGDRLVFSNLTD
jgi:hypothetical protein